MEDNLKLNGIVIDTTDVNEADRDVVLYTYERGRIRARFRGVNKPRAKLKAYASLFSFGEYLFSERGGLYVATGCTPAESFFELSADPVRFYSGLFVLKSLAVCGEDGSGNPALFTAGIKALGALAYSEFAEGNTRAPLAKFMLSALNATGYVYNFSACAECGRSDGILLLSPSAGILCTACGGQAVRLTGEARRYLEALKKADGFVVSPHADEAYKALLYVFTELFGKNSAAEFI